MQDDLRCKMHKHTAVEHLIVISRKLEELRNPPPSRKVEYQKSSALQRLMHMSAVTPVKTAAAATA